MMEEIIESAKAAQDISKTASQAIKITAVFSDWIDKMAGGVIKE